MFWYQEVLIEQSNYGSLKMLLKPKQAALLSHNRKQLKGGLKTQFQQVHASRQ